MTHDLLLFNGRIHTMDPRMPLVSALAIRDGTIVFAGSDGGAREGFGSGRAGSGRAGSGRDELDLGGRCALPGLCDSHLHFAWFAQALASVETGAPSLDEALARVRRKAERSAPGEWITGSGWDHNVWAGLGGGFPSRRHLDTAAPANPVALKGKSGHALWVNSMALDRAGIPAETQPSGILLENDMRLVQSVIPDPSPEELARLMRAAQEAALRAGVTCIHDFDGPLAFRALQILEARGELALRVCKGISATVLDEAIALGLRSGFGSERLWIGPAKFFADGALGSRTAWMLEPFTAGLPEHPLGIPVMSEGEMSQSITRANAAGISCAIHAIGDAAVRATLNAFAQSRATGGHHDHTVPLPNRIEHAQLVHLEDIPRFAALNIIASMQPTHATSDMDMAERHWGERCAGAYAWRSLLDAGASLVFGSDCPVESLNPLAGIHAAVTRRRPDGSPGSEGWHPEQRLTVAEAVHAFTVASAAAAGKERELGRLAPGMRADVTVLEKDIFSIDPHQIKDAGVHATVIGGRIRFRMGDSRTTQPVSPR